MQTVLIEGTDLRTSRFIFGTASLFNVGTSSTRRDLLSAAVDAGFTHFDTAPYYGFGAAERDLASVLRAHPHVTVTTKVGIYSPGGEEQMDGAIFVRKAIGRFVKSVSRPTIDFSIDRARNALEGSLKRLGRESIDLYMLHEPELALVATEEWQRWLDDCVRDGKVRHFGLALMADRLAPFLESQRVIGNVIQMYDSLQGCDADILATFGKPMQITYGYVSAALKESQQAPVPEVLKQALLRNHNGAVVVSSTKRNRLAQYSRIVEDALHDS